MFKNFWNDESGQGMVEYALIVALIAVVAIVAVKAVGKGVGGKLNEIASDLGESTSAIQ